MALAASHLLGGGEIQRVTESERFLKIDPGSHTERRIITGEVIFP